MPKTIADPHPVKNGITGTLTAWSMTVTPLTEGAASPGEMLSAADLFFLDLALNSDKDKTATLAGQAADEMALMMIEYRKTDHILAREPTHELLRVGVKGGSWELGSRKG